MAEFCLKCWRYMFEDPEDPEDPYDDDEFHQWTDLCEGCGEVKICVEPKRGPVARLKHNIRRKKRQKEGEHNDIQN